MEDKSGWKNPTKSLVEYQIKRYTKLAERMDELLFECSFKADYSGAKEAEIKRNCYNRFVADLKLIIE